MEISWLWRMRTVDAEKIQKRGKSKNYSEEQSSARRICHGPQNATECFRLFAFHTTAFSSEEVVDFYLF